MPDTFQKKSDFEEEPHIKDELQIPSLTEDIVYCPKCGTINSFKKSKSGRLLNHFCSRCGLRMNDFWDGYLEGHIKQTRCNVCKQTTFDGSFYCIACGAKQEKAYRERTEKISELLGEDLGLTSALEEVREAREKVRLEYPCCAGFCDCMACLNECGDCFICCVPFGSCIAVPFDPKITPILKTAFSISFVLMTMVQSLFIILNFHSYIGNGVLYIVIVTGVILAFLVPFLLYKIIQKNRNIRERKGN